MLRMMPVENQARLNAVPNNTQNRILDIPCEVCGDFSSGKHYNIYACDGCAGFFKRSIRNKRSFPCKGAVPNACVVDKAHRNQCRACRLRKCEEVGMNKDAVQQERGPRNETIRRAVRSYFQGNRRAPFTLRHPEHSILHLPPLIFPGAASVPQLQPRVPNHWQPNIHSLPYPPPPPASSPPFLLDPHTMCEAAAQILFQNIDWLKKSTDFRTLPENDQFKLVREGWKNLFILESIMHLPRMNLHPLMEASDMYRSPEALSFIMRVGEFESILLQGRLLALEEREYTCLREMLLFTCSSNAGDQNEGWRVAREAHNHLLKVMEPERFNQVVFLVGKIHALPGSVIEELFFKRAIGSISITNILTGLLELRRVANDVL